MAHILHRLAIPFLLLVFSAPSALAQQEYFDGALDYETVDGRKVCSYEGKPLQGLCKIKFIDIDFAPQYLIAAYADGVQGDTVSYYTANSDVLLSRRIRIGDRETHVTEYYGEGRPRSEYRLVDGRLEGLRSEWYPDATPYTTEEYAAGELHGLRTEWDEQGIIRSMEHYREGVPDGKSVRMTDPQTGRFETDYFRRSSRPYLTEWYEMRGEGCAVLIRRVVPDGEGHELHSASKPDCDFSRIDTVVTQQGAQGISIEVRDYTDGMLRSYERYTPDYSNAWIPDGVFENYNADGTISERLRFEEGRLTASRGYGSDDEQRYDARMTRLTKPEYEELANNFRDSKHFDGCDIQHPLRIRNARGEVIFEREDENRRFEYYGYDPSLRLHLAFSSVGDYNDVFFYVVHENGGGEYLEIQPELLAVNGDTGMIAAVFSDFEGEYDIMCCRYFPGEEPGSGYFAAVFDYTITDGPDALWGVRWIGDSSLLLIAGEEEFVRMDFSPEYLQEPGCPEEGE